MNTEGASALRIVIYPGSQESRALILMCAMVVSSFVGLGSAIHFGGIWWGAAASLVAFLGVYVAMVPFMTAWNLAEVRIERSVRAIVEEELIRYDLQTYDRQLRRVITDPEMMSRPPGA